MVMLCAILSWSSCDMIGSISWLAPLVALTRCKKEAFALLTTLLVVGGVRLWPAVVDLKGFPISRILPRIHVGQPLTVLFLKPL